MEKIKNFSTMAFIFVMMTFPRSYFGLRIITLGFFIMVNLISILFNRSIKVNFPLIIFYLVFSLLGSVASFIGILNGGVLEGITGSFRLFVLWSVLYAIIFTMINNEDISLIAHYAFLFSGFSIVFINIFGLINSYLNLELIPLAIQTELDLRIGFHEGFIQITTENITSLFFLVPYFISLQFRGDMNKLNKASIKICLILLLVVSILSGRRALWLCIFFTPLIILSIIIIAGKKIQPNIKNVRLLFLFLILIIIGLFIISLFVEKTGALEHLLNAFSATDERSIQKSFLLNGFYSYPIFGSGFGIGVEYIRSQTMPWMYELTYYQILLNFGIIGSIVLLVMIIGFILKAAKVSINAGINSGFAFCSLTGIISFFIGAYSNPYFASFDFLYILGLLPFISGLGISRMDRRNNLLVSTKVSL